jgi:CRP-like cAMP-binding protein
MPMDWLNKPIEMDWLNTPIEQGVAEMMARKRRARLIEELRVQLQGRSAPSVQVRLQLCDLLIQAERGREAVPVLLGLADEFAADGFVAKAVAILKRVERMDPGPHVASRLARLVGQQQRYTPVPGQSQDIGMEGSDPSHEIAVELEPVDDEDDDDARELEVSSETESPALAAAPEIELAVESPTDAVVAEAVPDQEPLPEPADTPPAAPEPPAGPAEPEASAAAEPEPSAAAEPEPTPSTPTEPDPLPDAFTVVREPEPLAVEMAPEPTGEVPPEPTPEAAPVEEPPVAAPAAAPAPGISRRIRGAFRRFLAALPGRTEDAAPALPASEPQPPEAVAEPAPDEAAGGEPEMTHAAFEARLLDIVTDVLQRPVERRAPQPLDRARILEYAPRLIATPLFGDLAEEELLAVMQGLRLQLADEGDVLVTEGEPGKSLFVLVSGAVKVFVRNPGGRNFAVAELREGDFFGEISSLSGRPRSATVVAAAPCELLELDASTLDGIARTHPRVCDVLESYYIQRASSPEAAAVRAVPLRDAGTQGRAIEILEAHFGETRWDPRMRLRLADLLLKAGKDEDAVPILVGLADDLAHQGFPEKAVAILKKIEQVQRRGVEEVNLSPLPAAARKAVAAAPPAPVPVAAPPTAGRAKPRTDEFFHHWLVDVVRDTVERRPQAMQAAVASTDSAPSVRGYGPGLRASPLFEDFSEDELLAFIQGLRLLSFTPGDVIVTEGEPGPSLFILANGAVKVFVRDPTGHDVPLCVLGEGAFFGEMAALSGLPRRATVTAAAACELLELDRVALDAITATHPRVREVLARFSEQRAQDPQAAAIRGEQ